MLGTSKMRNSILKNSAMASLVTAQAPSKLTNNQIYGTSIPSQPHNGRHYSTNPRETPSLLNHETASTQLYREQQEKANNSIWDAITQKDYECFQKEEQQKLLRRREEQHRMRKFLEAQMKEKEYKRGIDSNTEQNQHLQLLQQIRKYDQVANQHYRNKKRLLEDQTKENFSLQKRKRDYETFNRSQNISQEMLYNIENLNKIKLVENQSLYDIKKIKEERKRQIAEDLSSQYLKKNSTKVLSKLDHLKQMDGEFNLLEKNQERHKQKIKELVKRNDLIYNNVKNSPYKNLAVVDKERESKLLKDANHSFVEELKRRNRIMDEIKRKKKQEYMNLKQTHQKQIEDKMIEKRQSSSIELLSDQIMVEAMKNHEKEVILQEQREEQERRKKCKDLLEEQKIANRSIDPNSQFQYTKEFELNRSLIRDISPNHSTLS